ncbi:ubiquinol oxidase subunit II [Tumebacillus flagellatus]|uniref:Quinol oxidase subunit 2 n=1 Tax=Tumebacillus flagellatus TaxID=1157490 RepID=A0A074LVT9_9BACL|nr:COX aromatic rich motif-containing protein [Tumebacillus flagellatus]KEO84138.1 cytochrome C oxidase subunit II [Tumebacillus flagellatus]
MKRNLIKLLTVLGATALLASGCDSRYIMLHPVGPVAKTELDLIYFSILLIAVIVIPVLALLIFIVYRYRNKPGNKAKYMPEWEDNKVLEYVWWGIPILIIGILGYQTAKTTFVLTEPPVKDVKPITIQVTSLNWKWLFQYPDQKVATVNYVEIPAGVPVQFVLTADAPINSFWVPQLGGQEYAMPGMAMRLWLQADKPGTYYGSGANFTGEGFQHMKFEVVAKPQAEFDEWAKGIKQKAPALTMQGYEDLQKPGVLDNVQEFSSYPEGLFHDIVMKDGGQYMDMSKMEHDLLK